MTFSWDFYNIVVHSGVYSNIYGTLVSLSVISEGVYLVLVFTILHSGRIFMQSGHSLCHGSL